MPISRPTGTKNETIRCENCGEYYSVTYKRCPFCEEYTAPEPRRRPASEEEDAPAPRRKRKEPVYDEFDDEYEDDYEEEIPDNRSGGRHLVTNTRGGGYGGSISPMKIIGGVLSLALIGAAIFIVVTIVRPFLKEKPVEPTPAPTPPVSTVAPTAAPTAPPETPALPGDPNAPVVVPSAGPLPQPTKAPVATPPSGQTATAFSIGKGDITLSDTWPTHVFKVTFTPAGSKGSITWSSSKPEVVTVDQNGKVTPVKSGNATITATMAGGYTATCIVRNNVGAGAGQPATSEKPAASPKPSAPAAAGLTLNHTDFTMHVGEAAVKLKVAGTSSAPVWSAKDSGIAKVSDNGSVTAVAKGTTKIIAEVDGKKLECIVRVLP